MSESERSAGDRDRRAQRRSKPTEEGDQAVPDLEAEPVESGRPEGPRNGGPGSGRAFSGGQWIVLWLVITLGVAAGHLLSNLITSVAVAYQMRIVMSDLAKGFGQVATDAQQEVQQAAKRREAERRARRRESDRGQSLARQCQDWRAAREEMDSFTTRRNTEKYCGAYREYIQTGRVSTD
ncbi:MAG: hypothetical protein U5K73_08555 [Halofilum sp. (in: g-proteobacteria)]|nr:hypothetical protein [Halofilum sp. (in: g-proteobacteria)]